LIVLSQMMKYNMRLIPLLKLVVACSSISFCQSSLFRLVMFLIQWCGVSLMNKNCFDRCLLADSYRTNYSLAKKRPMNNLTVKRALDARKMKNREMYKKIFF